LWRRPMPKLGCAAKERRRRRMIIYTPPYLTIT
jgi:hypothetical protein